LQASAAAGAPDSATYHAEFMHAFTCAKGKKAVGEQTVQSVEIAREKGLRKMDDYQKLVEEKYNINRSEQIDKRLSGMPITCKATYKKAVKHKSMRAAINSQCLECVGYQRKEVSLCTDLGCPLYSYRPYQKRDKGAETPSGFSKEAILEPSCAVESI